MSLVKLTSLSTQTLSLLLERQRLQSIPQFQSSTSSTSNLHIPQIKRNLSQLRTGILDLESKYATTTGGNDSVNGAGEAIGLLKNQYGRMRAMLGDDAESLGIESLDSTSTPVGSASTSHDPSSLPSHTPTPVLIPQPPQPKDSEPVYSPYTDDPEAGYDPGIMLQTQKRMMDDQDNHLQTLSTSLNRQHSISLAINSELEEHHGLLEELDTELDGTQNRLRGARRRLERVGRGVKGNGSTVAIALLILVLLILIIVFKT
jgi:syntaxin 8